MVKTIRVPDEYHEWLSAHKREDETMGEALRRLTHGPPPAEAVLSEAQADEMREAVERVREGDRDRLKRVADRLDDADLG
jgi:predicted CopG family antitoxin